MSANDYYVNRELSFLKFNKRVLEEAEDKNTPLFERFKFISIFHSNLDEFYMIRVGSLYEKSLLKDGGSIFNDDKTGWSPERQLKEIFRETKNLYKEADNIFASASALLKERGIAFCRFEELDKTEKKWLKSYFKREILPLLSPQIIDTKHPFPHFLEKRIYIILELHREDRKSHGIISQNRNISRIIELPDNGTGEFRYILSEDIIYNYAKELFKKHRIVSKLMLRVIRNADVNAEENLKKLYDYGETADGIDFRSHMDKLLKKRGKLAPVRLQLSGGKAEIESKSKIRRIKKYLCEKLNIKEEQAFFMNAPLDMSFVFGIQDRIQTTHNAGEPREGLFHAPITHAMPDNIGRSIIETVENGQDIFLHYPKHSIKAYIKLLEESVADPNVLSVKITLYRLSENSQIIDCLCRLAESGKQVTAVVELAARFDEENNINWSKRLEEAGCTLVYGVEGYKIHSKITLITKKRGSDNSIAYITHAATGNYNEKTARLYTDTGIITSNRNIGGDAHKFFNSITVSDPSDGYSCLLVAPLQFRSEIIKLIGGEAEKGASGRIRLMMNSLTDRAIIEALVSASQAGVQTELIIRGICCLLPGIAGKTENIRVRSIVGRFLEHSRIFIFGGGAQVRIYISSADLMTRNTTRRLEIAAPVFDAGIKKEIVHIFDLYARDNTKARELKPTGDYERVTGADGNENENENGSGSGEYINAQEFLFERRSD